MDLEIRELIERLLNSTLSAFVQGAGTMEMIAARKTSDDETKALLDAARRIWDHTCDDIRELMDEQGMKEKLD